MLVRQLFINKFARIFMNNNIHPNELAIFFAFILLWVELILGAFLIFGYLVSETSFFYHWYF